MVIRHGGVNGDTARDNGGRTLKTTRISLRILELIMEYDGLTLAELDRLLDKPKSSLRSHLHTLLDARYLIRRDGVYAASFRLSWATLPDTDAYKTLSRETVSKI